MSNDASAQTEASTPSLPEFGEPTEDLRCFLKVEEAAKLLRISRTSAYELARQWELTGGRLGLPVVRLGRLLRVPRAALDRLADGTAQASE